MLSLLQLLQTNFLKATIIRSHIDYKGIVHNHPSRTKGFEAPSPAETNTMHLRWKPNYIRVSNKASIP